MLLCNMIYIFIYKIILCYLFPRMENPKWRELPLKLGAQRACFKAQVHRAQKGLNPNTSHSFPETSQLSVHDIFSFFRTIVLTPCCNIQTVISYSYFRLVTYWTWFVQKMVADPTLFKVYPFLCGIQVMSTMFSKMFASMCHAQSQGHVKVPVNFFHIRENVAVLVNTDYKSILIVTFWQQICIINFEDTYPAIIMLTPWMSIPVVMLM